MLSDPKVIYHPARPCDWSNNLHPGILKNPSYIGQSQTSPSSEGAPPAQPQPTERPTFGRELSEKEIVLENTLRNAGPHRRSTSNPRGPGSRRQSGTSAHADENSPKLKWDEANLYLTEQQRDSTMKITEPKTPYAKQYDPAEDEAEVEMLNAEELKVDELDKPKTRKPRIDNIPEFDLGEPELEARTSHTPESEKRVMVDPDAEVEAGHHGEEFANMTPDEQEKHKKFEELRKKHYEMKNVKDLLG
jgi:protein phosphatase inhibitor 2